MAVALVNLLTPGEDRSRAYEPPAGVERAAALNALFTSAGSKTKVTSTEAEAFVSRRGRPSRDLRLGCRGRPRRRRAPGQRPADGHRRAPGPGTARRRTLAHPLPLRRRDVAVQGLGGRLRDGAGHRPRRRTVRPARRVHRAALRPGLRRHLTQRKQAILLHRLPEPGQGRRLPRTPRLGPGSGELATACSPVDRIWRESGGREEAEFVRDYCLRCFSSLCAASARRLIALSRLSHWAASSAMALVAWSRRSASTW